MLYRFESFQLDLERYELRAGGEPVPLQPRPFDVLRYLVEQAPRTVPKEELLEQVWSDAHTSEGVLTQAVSQLRRALSEVAGGDALVETISGRGYRIAVPVQSGTPDTAPADHASHTADSHAPRPRPAGTGRRTAALLVLVLAGVGLGGVSYLTRAPPRPAAVKPSAATPSINPSAVAVLPFEDSSAEPTGYLGDAVAEQVMSSLARTPSVLVVARTSAFAFKDSEEDVGSIGSLLGAAYVLEGTVRRAGDQLRVTAELVDTQTGFSRWARIWERDVADLFAVQQEIASEVSRQVALGVETFALPGPVHRPRDFHAYDAYLRGMAALRLRDRASLEQAVAHFEDSLARDPGYADAWAGLSTALGEIWAQYSTEPRNGPLLARSGLAARRAFELDPNNPGAMRQMARRRENEGDVAGARALLERAARIRPRSVELRLQLASHLAHRGELEPALEHAERAVELDPFSAIAHLQLGRLCFYAGDSERAVQNLERAAELSPEYTRIAAQLSIVYRATGRMEDSREAFLRLLPERGRPFARALTRVLGDDRFVRALFAYGELRTGDVCIERPEFAAHVFAAIGDTDAMFTCLRREVIRRHGWYLAVEPIYDPYRKDPRFIELLQTSGLTPADASRQPTADSAGFGPTPAPDPSL